MMSQAEGSTRNKPLLEDTFDITPIGLEFCLDRQTFLEPNFDVDRFVVEHKKKVSLEKLRDDLIQYHNILKSSLIELINQDYADFVHLSTHLVGLDKALSKLREPLDNLKNDVDSVQENIEAHVRDIESQFEERRRIRRQKALLNNLKDLILTTGKLEALLKDYEQLAALPIESEEQVIEEQALLLARMGRGLSKLRYLQQKCSGHNILAKLQQRVNYASQEVQSRLNKSLLEAITQKQWKFVKQLLIIYIEVDAVETAERLIGTQCFRNQLDQLVASSKSSASPFEEFLSEVLKFAQRTVAPIADRLTEFSKGYDAFRQFDVMLNSLWPEVANILCEQFADVFAPARPDTFHKNFSQYESFIVTFTNMIGGNTLGPNKLRQHESFTRIQRKWGLPVYFQLRFQDVSSQVEEVMRQCKDGTLECESQPFHGCVLRVSVTCMQQSASLWSERVYLAPLSHRLWKLNVQILNRYALWLHQITQSHSTGQTDHGKNSKSASSPVKSTQLSVRERVLLLHDWQRLFEWCYNDLLPNHVLKVLLPLTNEQSPLKQSMYHALWESAERSLHYLDCVEKDIVKAILDQCVVFTRAVNDVPRQYRKTNREAPTRASNYVGQMLQPLLTFSRDMRSLTPTNVNLLTEVSETSCEQVLREGLTKNACRVWRCMVEVVRGVAKSYHSLLMELISSVRKMEESLMKLRRARGGGSIHSSASSASLIVATLSGSSGNETSADAPVVPLSDDDKIRLQLYLDACHFRTQVVELFVSSKFCDTAECCDEMLPELADLVNLTDSARRPVAAAAVAAVADIATPST